MDRLQSFTINGFPMPPSVNQLYAWSPRAGRMVKSKLCGAYERTVGKWILTNGSQLEQLRLFTKDLGAYVFDVDAMFYMERKAIICKDGKPKKNDTSNRIKALHDVLSSIVGVDDSYFWSLSADKQVLPLTYTKPYVDITFKLRNIEELV
jgi:hypothetical protein